MNERDGLFLNHILSAITEIGSFTADGRDGFMSDRKTQPKQTPCVRRPDPTVATLNSAEMGLSEWH